MYPCHCPWVTNTNYKIYPKYNALYYIAANSAVPRPLLEKLRSCLVTCHTMPCPKGIQSVTQPRAKVYVGASKLKVWEVAWLVWLANTNYVIATRMQILKCHRASVSHRLYHARASMPYCNNRAYTELYTARPWRKNLFSFSCCLSWWLLSTPGQLRSWRIHRRQLLRVSEMQLDVNGWQASGKTDKAVVRHICVACKCALLLSAVSL